MRNRPAIVVLLLLCASLIAMPMAFTPPVPQRGLEPSLRDQIIKNTDRIEDLERRMEEQEKELDAHERTTSADPTTIAVLQNQLKNVADLQDKQISIAAWTLRTIAGICATLALWAGKRWLARFTPPAWAEKEAVRQDLYREHMVRNLDDVKAAADEARLAAKKVLDSSNPSSGC